MVTSKRLTEANVRELDQKIQMETYLKEKKQAILDDRKEEIQRTSLLNPEED